MTNVLITGVGGQHDQDVGEAFIRGYQSNAARYSGNLFINNFGYENTETALAYANTNNYEIVIQSTIGADQRKVIANRYYPNVMLFMPAGANNSQYVYSGSATSNNNSIITTGTINNLSQNNITGYNIEFSDLDVIDNAGHSSYSNGYIAGKIAYIKDWYKCSFWEARYIARQTASLSNNFTDKNGFGTIDIKAAISTYIEIPEDPILNLSSVGNINVSRTLNKISINIDAVENASNYKIFRNDELIYDGANLTYIDTIIPKDEFYYNYKAYNNKQETELSESKKIVYRAYSSILYL
jgi:hypothetical protein